ncbi:MAG TPA: GNAT family N-acetyltransferase [Flavobacteriales bacterium]|nr:GNAT family N-acetyltransferase [Flavobacteriales bacterium]HMR27011.1 GNAT family N-acetyltransferase [Flavobacteriales bacterium]
MKPLLHPITPADIAHIHRGLSHPEVIRYYAVRFMTLEATQEQMDWYATIEREGTGKWWAIRSTADDTFLGAIGINHIHPEHRRCELGYWLLPEHWGKGIISGAIGQVLHHAFHTLGLHRVVAEVETENPASARVLLKNGFRHEGTLHECERKDGRWISLDVYAKLAPGQP